MEKKPHSKSDVRYWQARVFKKTFTVDGERRQASDYSVRIQRGGRRETFPLHTGSKTEAGKLAKEIYQVVVGSGWEAAMQQYKAPKVERLEVLTVGHYLAEVEAIATVVPRTLEDYKRAFRQIVVAVERITDAGKTKKQRGSKFDYRAGGRERWVARVDAIPLNRITPRKIQRWKLDYVREKSEGNPERARRARTSVNSLMRQAKSLFGEKRVPHLRHLDLPSPLPFDGVDFYPRESKRYSSTIDAASLYSEAAEELADKHPESWKIFLLALGAGLRRGEIDTLLWEQIDFDRKLVRIKTTQYFKPKSEDSAGEVEIDDELVEILRELYERGSGEFVIESSRDPKPGASYSFTRAESAFKTLYLWLQNKGVKDSKPLHTLRKEFGSIICQKAGLYAASRLLRHADIAVTASYYLDKKERVTVGIGALAETSDDKDS